MDTSSSSSSSNDGEYSEADSLLQETWQLANNYIYGSNDISFIPDPYISSSLPNGTMSSQTPSSSTVMRIKYGEGSYSPSGSTDAGRTGGLDFYSRPFGNQSYARALLQYDMAFDASFDWMRGGKLPGLYGGTPNNGCSGGRQADGQNCFSVRLMWRENGLGEAYLYIPTDDAFCKETPGVICNKEYGTSMFRGRIKYPKEQWTRIEIFTQINDPSWERNGVLQIWQDDEPVMEMTGLQYRTTNAVAISSLMFSTFFGGGSSDYATPHDTYAYFKNIQFSVAEPVHLSPPTIQVSSAPAATTTVLTLRNTLIGIVIPLILLFVMKVDRLIL
ncbi:hypothetical protein BCR42DRAFT_315217 [Absidia repens]|uniref:Polysaccharide lyase 14 domain-containing protein n=1 Tax=Absidia repens TaxID=90262 RepID=A0A1X2J2P7_9FUNG|nr:hypothetical protein BCR42DRAFT_315217 [Absidia repens]